MSVYIYEGPVLEFERCIAGNYKATTTAPSPRKALSNIGYRFKKEHGKLASCKIALDPDKLQEVKE